MIKIVTLWSEIKITMEKFLVVIRTTRNHFLVIHSHFLGVEDMWTHRFSYLEYNKRQLTFFPYRLIPITQSFCQSVLSMR